MTEIKQDYFKITDTETGVIELNKLNYVIATRLIHLIKSTLGLSKLFKFPAAPRNLFSRLLAALDNRIDKKM